MQFQVPQYIDVEDHIVGPLTLKQFLYIATGFLVIFTTFFFFVSWLWIATSAVTAALSLSLALVKYNGRPLPKAAAAAFRYLMSPKKYSAGNEAGRAAEPDGGLLSKLGLELMAGTKPVPRRERAINAFFGRSLPAQDGSEAVRNSAGDVNIAKRVDYR